MTAADPTGTPSAELNVGEIGRQSESDRATAAVSETVVSVVADALGKDEMAVEPLNDVIDPDALDALFDARLNGERRPTTGRVQFLLDECEVTVFGDGQVVVRP